MQSRFVFQIGVVDASAVECGATVIQRPRQAAGRPSHLPRQEPKRTSNVYPAKGILIFRRIDNESHPDYERLGALLGRACGRFGG